jgi:hypothetical protein
VSSYDVGSLIRCSADFTVNKVRTDPTALSFKYLKPNASVYVLLTYGVDGALVKDSIGNYHVDLNCDVDGLWEYRWASTGTGQAAQDGTFFVLASPLMP